jgi:uncharacterized membrane protein YagU involved in acid resistance
VLDLGYVIVFYGSKAVLAGTATFGAVAARIPKGIAAGLLGAPAALAGGAGTIVLGVALHFTIALGAAAAFYAASRRWRFLTGRRGWWTAGLVFGVAVWLFMQLVVLPLSAVPPKTFPPPQWLPVFIAHLVCVGLPIAGVTRRLAPSPPFSARMAREW